MEPCYTMTPAPARSFSSSKGVCESKPDISFDDSHMLTALSIAVGDGTEMDVLFYKQYLNQVRELKGGATNNARKTALSQFYGAVITYYYTLNVSDPGVAEAYRTFFTAFVNGFSCWIISQKVYTGPCAEHFLVVVRALTETILGELYMRNEALTATLLNKVVKFLTKVPTFKAQLGLTSCCAGIDMTSFKPLASKLQAIIDTIP